MWVEVVFVVLKFVAVVDFDKDVIVDIVTFVGLVVDLVFTVDPEKKL